MKSALAFIGIAILGLAATLVVAVVLIDEPERKMNENSSWENVSKVLEENYNAKTFSSAIGWMINGKIVYESDVYASTGISTKVQKATFVRKMYEQGYKRVRQVCKGINSKDASWSMGYCYNVEILQEKGVA